MTKEDILNVVTRQTPNFPPSRLIQLTDLFKWVARIKGLLAKDQGLSSVSQNLVLQEQIFLEGFDIFLASSESLMIEKDDLANNIDLAAAHCICRCIPDFIPPTHKNRSGSSAKAKTSVTIGRTKHLIDSSKTMLSSSDCRPFALTKSTLVLSERLAVCMRSSKPTLLVGETGTGKTTVVQEPGESVPTQDYVLTKLVKSKIIVLARAVTTGKWPVLIRGPTSSGKTSTVAYIAHLTGHPFVQINNHEHTDIQEYIGSYAPDPKTGRLCFNEGALVQALRQGAWIVLDELNLAPSDVLEALNRLLDDNR
ncbi:hypothetical protein PCASD_20445 [Puccinia coronata f. sp. avenae]|uniref:ATPase dynein-related AAA domain-containing protein n=1 Tax=Puccinia coronata f. sp. avenae TaxID=200324 RepID=A0A2N5TQR1_9BASI|nr:hypothetical protein PCASD_20445 [Puccinia coronata f. sp. avenae]